MEDQRHILNDKITFRELIIRLGIWLGVLRANLKFILIAVLIGAFLGLAASFLKKPVYSAETTFVLEETDMGGLGNISGIASMLGLNLGSLGSGNGLFQGDNIMELYKSESMLSKTLLSPFSMEDSGYLLIHRYIDFNKLASKWKRKVDINQLDFNLPRTDYTVQQDSVVREIIKEIRKKNLSVTKPDRKLSIIKVAIATKDEKFSKSFNEQLVENVNGFYLQTKTKKTSENLAILQLQSDSVRTILDRDLRSYATLQDQVPNANPLLQKGTVDAKSKQVDVQASIAVYEEIVKNLEIAKINHRNNSPLIQIIDAPRLPLEESKIKMKAGVLIGAVVFLLLAVLYIYISTLYKEHINQSVS